jgi:NAD(P)-dependent dehydrogenase (short-subunit alcohol dehydrogenase family)
MTKSDDLSRREFVLQAAATLATSAVAGSIPGVAKGDESGAESVRKPLQGKVAVVTGAARGIGRAIAVRLARGGADVMGIDIAGPVSPASETFPATRKDLEETESLVKAQSRRFIPVVADVRNLKELRDASAKVEKEWGKVDIVVGNAAIQTFKPFIEMDDADWHDIIDVNLNGYANTARAFLPSMIARKKGRLIFISSTQGRMGTKDGASYSASKWGIIGLMKSLALEMGEHHITVNAVIPGLIDTALTRNPVRWRALIAQTGIKPPEHPSEAEAAAASKIFIPLGVPWLKPEDVAPAVAFLATDDAYMISGATYDVTGGASAHYTA